jgi:hypothetical protein
MPRSYQAQSFSICARQLADIWTTPPRERKLSL